MIECKRCKKQYIGETKRTLRERFTEHRQATNNPSHANASAAVPLLRVRMFLVVRIVCRLIRTQGCWNTTVI